MKSNDLRIKQAKRFLLIFSMIAMLSGAFIQQGEAQFGPYYPPAFPYYGSFPAVAPPPFYGYLNGYLPTRSAAVVLPTTLLPTLLAPTTTTTAAPIIGVSTAITLATLGGTGLSATALVALSTTPVPTVTTTPTIGVTTALLLSGSVSTTTLLLLGI